MQGVRMEAAQKMGGKYWSHSTESKRKMAKKAKARWAAMSEKKRAAISKKISRAKKGKKTQTAEQIEARRQKLKAFWANLSPEERSARGAKAAKARRAVAMIRPKK